MGVPEENAPGFPFWMAKRTSLSIELARKLKTCRPEFSAQHCQILTIKVLNQSSLSFKKIGNLC